MNWLKRKLYNWINNDSLVPTYKNDLGSISTSRWSSAGQVETDGLDSEPMVLKVFRANGGTVIETRSWDRGRDIWHTHLHIVGNDQELGDSLAKIITMESLRG